MLAVLAEFLPEIPDVTQTGVYDAQTQSAVSAFQSYAGLPVTGSVDEPTWNAIYSQYTAIDGDVFENGELFPYTREDEATPAGAFAPPAPRFESTTRFVQFPGMTLSEGMQDAEVVS